MATQASERLIPFDIIPRVFAAAEWRGSRQGSNSGCGRSMPSSMTLPPAGNPPGGPRARRTSSSRTKRSCRRWWASIRRAASMRISSASTSCASAENEFYVLEDNCRTPSGVSYMLEDRETMMYLFPELFAQQRVAPVENYPPCCARHWKAWRRLPARANRRSWCSRRASTTRRFFEHAFLADEMGVELCEGDDLFVIRRRALHAHHARAEAR
jgi:uncharacterized circularly permuted ATP-grasp superfamily protein